VNRRDGRGSFPRPRRWAGPVFGTVLALLGWAAVAHNSGAGWVQALGALLAGFLFVGLVAPAFAVRRVRCTVTESPADGRAGHPVSVTVAVSSPVEITARRPAGPPVLAGARRRCPVELVPAGRGVVTSVDITVASAAPFGLLWWTKRIRLPLPRPLLVAPRVGPPDPATLSSDGTDGEDQRRVDARVGEPRGVRPYRPGDLRHWVHWPATAHSAVLMVREMEQPTSRPVVVQAWLPGDPDAAERAAERALGTVTTELGQGRAVILVTKEDDGVHREAVRGVTDAGRRLARAVP
jgi:uncharacterized protein (DUF58 family)